GRPPTDQQQQVVMKKRFRTKFTQEQKDKMFNFAEKVGWKFQKQEESLVQQFCQEIGVKRRVLKVWMHNNKHNLAKKQLQDEHTTANHLPTP
ncbi:ZF-HD homeobox protein, partial [Trifolium medium]|nr:ZF-HD homeobox protein [Trifolium medium]